VKGQHLQKGGVLVKKLVWILVVVAVMGLYIWDLSIKRDAYEKVVSSMFERMEELEAHSAIAEEICRSTGRVEDAVTYWNAIVNN
jgi:hypothetical protein